MTTVIDLTKEQEKVFNDIINEMLSMDLDKLLVMSMCIGIALTKKIKGVQ